MSFVHMTSCSLLRLAGGTFTRDAGECRLIPHRPEHGSKKKARGDKRPARILPFKREFVSGVGIAERSEKAGADL
jgi:hypothetical protein